MGVDARMFVRVEGKLTQDDIQKQAYIFGQAFKYNLFLGYDGEVFSHPLEVHIENSEDYTFGITIGTGETLIKVPLAGRYYSKDYARGPILTYVAIAEFLERLFSGCEIFYCGDSGEYAEPFDKNRREQLISFFIESGNDSYRRYFSGNHEKYICPVCKVGMVQNGFKGKLGFFTCGGCGWCVNEVSETEVKSGFNIKFL